MMNIKASDYYDNDQYDITLISQTRYVCIQTNSWEINLLSHLCSVVRLFYIPYVQNQWKGYESLSSAR